MIFIGIGLICLSVALVVGVKIRIETGPVVPPPEKPIVLSKKDIDTYHGRNVPPEEAYKNRIPE